MERSQIGHGLRKWRSVKACASRSGRRVTPMIHRFVDDDGRIEAGAFGTSGEHGRKFYVLTIVSFWLYLFDNISWGRHVILGRSVLHAVDVHLYSHGSTWLCFDIGICSLCQVDCRLRRLVRSNWNIFLVIVQRRDDVVFMSLMLTPGDARPLLISLRGHLCWCLGCIRCLGRLWGFCRQRRHVSTHRNGGCWFGNVEQRYGP